MGLGRGGGGEGGNFKEIHHIGNDARGRLPVFYCFHARASHVCAHKKNQTRGAAERTHWETRRGESDHRGPKQEVNFVGRLAESNLRRPVERKKKNKAKCGAEKEKEKTEEEQLRRRRRSDNLFCRVLFPENNGFSGGKIEICISLSGPVWLRDE